LSRFGFLALARLIAQFGWFTGENGFHATMSLDAFLLDRIRLFPRARSHFAV